eukprot:CAMPEP_0197578126 /NCGR_PEP_ID=MMETSP1326-20131121/2483_1 /TAXON_ID=1155430 /ORGANISM="Genus nov. species nov., Strain RCC2288" /LENGTH=75 /DNA_ID=CAMNT_0043141285 /DNA_START=176 /DNA_END=400 /DNA_ORIENTATION=+
MSTIGLAAARGGACLASSAAAGAGARRTPWGERGVCGGASTHPYRRLTRTRASSDPTNTRGAGGGLDSTGGQNNE